MNKIETINKLNSKENKKALWDFVFPSKVCGRKAHLGGIGPKALTLKLETSKTYPHLDIKCFLNWNKFDEFTPEEKKLVESLLNQL